MINRSMEFIRSVSGLPLTILCALFVYQKPMPIEELTAWTTYEDDKLRKSLDVLERMGYIEYSVGERGRKFYRLSNSSQQYLPGMLPVLPASEPVESINPDSEKSEPDTLSSSSNNILINDSKLINTITTITTSDSEKSESEIETEYEFKTRDVRRILEATTILFGEPGVFTRGLRLEIIHPDIALGWVKQGWNAKNLELCKRAGVVYNGLKSGEKPKTAYLHSDNDNLPKDYLVAIGLETKQCPKCHEDFPTLESYDEHWKICIQTVTPEPEEEEQQILDEKDFSIYPEWEKVLNSLAQEMPRASYDTWVRDTRAVAWESETKKLVIGVRNSYAKNWLETRVKSTIQRLLNALNSAKVEIEFEVVS